ncbi:hypothetical protein GcC1_043023 [Golovinomyces cichoracearum]|uniref:Uncharacterized protein n=1 Tax=Golovinomyces cichoracearum TaxID=62708 RepID=A0A420IYU7_9PEZI|nr:hypothetical protein GcC1_043023 [Golovinomyces cichoracearum]
MLTRSEAKTKSSSSNNVPSEKSENEEQALTKQTGTPTVEILSNIQPHAAEQRAFLSSSSQDEFLISSDNIEEVGQLVCDLVPKRVYTEINSRKCYMSALPQSPTQIELNTIVAAIRIEIERANEVDDNLLDGYKVWFDGWTKQYFEILHPWLQRIVRKQLKDRGIFLGHGNLKTTTILVELLTMLDVPEWPDLVLTK